jgi:hypothetical protein
VLHIRRGLRMYYFVFPGDRCRNAVVHCCLDVSSEKLAIREAFRALTEAARDANSREPSVYAVEILGDDRTPLMRAILRLDVEQLGDISLPRQKE